MLSIKRSDQTIRVNSRSVMMRLLEHTDGFTTGSGLLSPDCSPAGVVSAPMAGKPVIRIGYILPTGGKPSAETERFITCLTAAVTDAIAYTRIIHARLAAARAEI